MRKIMNNLEYSYAAASFADTGESEPARSIIHKHAQLDKKLDSDNPAPLIQDLEARQ